MEYTTPLGFLVFFDVEERYMDVEPKIGGFFTPKWMVKIMKKPCYCKMDDLGVPLFLETPICQWLFLVPLKGGR